MKIFVLMTLAFCTMHGSAETKSAAMVKRERPTHAWAPLPKTPRNESLGPLWNAMWRLRDDFEFLTLLDESNKVDSQYREDLIQFSIARDGMAKLYGDLLAEYTSRLDGKELDDYSARLVMLETLVHGVFHQQINIIHQLEGALFNSQLQVGFTLDAAYHSKSPKKYTRDNTIKPVLNMLSHAEDVGQYLEALLPYALNYHKEITQQLALGLDTDLIEKKVDSNSDLVLILQNVAEFQARIKIFTGATLDGGVEIQRLGRLKDLRSRELLEVAITDTANRLRDKITALEALDTRDPQFWRDRAHGPLKASFHVMRKFQDLGLFGREAHISNYLEPQQILELAKAAVVLQHAIVAGAIIAMVDKSDGIRPTLTDLGRMLVGKVTLKLSSEAALQPVNANDAKALKELLWAKFYEVSRTKKSAVPFSADCRARMANLTNGENE